MQMIEMEINRKMNYEGASRRGTDDEDEVADKEENADEDNSTDGEEEKEADEEEEG